MTIRGIPVESFTQEELTEILTSNAYYHQTERRAALDELMHRQYVMAYRDGEGEARDQAERNERHSNGDLGD